MKQTLLRIAIPDGKTLYPSHFRKIMGSQQGTNEKLFHYSDGRPSNGRPAVRFVGARGWVGILADESGGNIVLDSVKVAMSAVSGHLGQVVRAQIEEHELGLRSNFSLSRYRVREMAIKTRHPRARQLQVDDLVKERLIASIEATAARYAIDCPIAKDFGIELAVTRNIGMRVGKGTGAVDEYVKLVNAEFVANIHLTGFWFAGNLTARGYGRIILDSPGGAQ